MSSAETAATAAQPAGAAPVVYISDLKRYIGEEVTVRGWVQHHRSKGKLQFIVMRDGTGVCQLVAFKGDLSEADWDAADKLSLESSFSATGAVRADERAPGGVEIAAQALAGLPVHAGLPHRREGARRRLPDGEPPPLAALERARRRRCSVRAAVIKALARLPRRARLHPGRRADPDAQRRRGHLDAVRDRLLRPAGLPQPERPALQRGGHAALGRVYCFGPTFRAEKSKTRRHLMEFWMVEPEVAFMELTGLLELEEQFVSYIVQTRAGDAPRGAEGAGARHRQAGADRCRPSRASPTTRRSPILQAHGEPRRQWGDDFGGDEETIAGAASSTSRCSSPTTRRRSRPSTCSPTPSARKWCWPPT